MIGTAHSIGAPRALARAGAALLAALSLACGRRETDAERRETLVVALETAPLHFDPRVLTDQASWRVADAVFNGLMKKGAAGEFVPDLAESLTTEDAVVWKARLRAGVAFHDGRPLTSADVAHTFRSLLADGFVSAKKKALEVIAEVATPSPLDVEFRLKAPYASFPLQLLLGIVPAGASVEEVDRHPVGTGPFRFVEYRPDDRVVFERAAPLPGAPRRLVYRIVPDTTTRALELMRGTLDLAVNSLPPDHLPRLERHPRLAVTIRPGANYAYLAFNLRDPALKDVRVREALDLALDRRALIHGLWRDTVEEAATLLPPGHWARDEELRPPARDLERARRLLTEAGYPDPGGGRPRLALTYKTSTDEMSILQATAIAEQWKEAGVKATIRSNDFAVFFQDVTRGSFQLFSLRWQGIVDPDHYHEVFLSTATPPGGWNRGFFSDPDMDRWIDAARREADRVRRRELYRLVQRRAAEARPYLSLYTTKTVAVHARDLTGLETIPPTADFTFLAAVGRR